MYLQINAIERKKRGREREREREGEGAGRLVARDIPFRNKIWESEYSVFNFQYVDRLIICLPNNTFWFIEMSFAF